MITQPLSTLNISSILNSNNPIKEMYRSLLALNGMEVQPTLNLNDTRSLFWREFQDQTKIKDLAIKVAINLSDIEKVLISDGLIKPLLQRSKSDNGYLDYNVFKEEINKISRETDGDLENYYNRYDEVEIQSKHLGVNFFDRSVIIELLNLINVRPQLNKHYNELETNLNTIHTIIVELASEELNEANLEKDKIIELRTKHNQPLKSLLGPTKKLIANDKPLPLEFNRNNKVLLTKIILVSEEMKNNIMALCEQEINSDNGILINDLEDIFIKKNWSSYNTNNPGSANYSLTGKQYLIQLIEATLNEDKDTPQKWLYNRGAILNTILAHGHCNLIVCSKPENPVQETTSGNPQTQNSTVFYNQLKNLKVRLDKLLTLMIGGDGDKYDINLKLAHIQAGGYLKTDLRKFLDQYQKSITTPTSLKSSTKDQFIGDSSVTYTDIRSYLMKAVYNACLTMKCNLVNGKVTFDKQFSTCLAFSVQKSMFDFHNEKNTIRIPPGFQHGEIKLFKKAMEKFIKQMAMDSNINLSHADQFIADENGWPLKKARFIRDVIRNIVNIHPLDSTLARMPSNFDGDQIKHEFTDGLKFLPVQSSNEEYIRYWNDQDPTYEYVETKLFYEELKSVFETLSPRERDVLNLRYGRVDGREKTLEEIGNIFNLTRERIRQIEAKALRKLRHPNRNSSLVEYWR